jgi:hypothetical protein
MTWGTDSESKAGANAPLGFSFADTPVHAPSAETPGRPGLPEALKAGVERLSGFAMDDVRVHRDSPEPAKLGALAFARGRDIHLGPGQERHLPHETWHVAQQKQGRVKATTQMKGEELNDCADLEAEADHVGRLVAAPSGEDMMVTPGDRSGSRFSAAASGSVLQRQTVDGGGGVTPRDNTQTTAINDAIRIKIKQMEAAAAAEMKKLREMEQLKKTLKPGGASDHSKRPEVTVGQAAPQSPFNKRFNQLMQIEMEYRENTLNAFDRKQAELNNVITNDYVRTQLYLLLHGSDYHSWLDQDSPVSIWVWLEMFSNAKGGATTYGVARDGMTSHIDPVPFVPNRELFLKHP